MFEFEHPLRSLPEYLPKRNLNPFSILFILTCQHNRQTRIEDLRKGNLTEFAKMRRSSTSLNHGALVPYPIAVHIILLIIAFTFAILHYETPIYVISETAPGFPNLLAPKNIAFPFSMGYVFFALQILVPPSEYKNSFSAVSRETLHKSGLVILTFWLSIILLAVDVLWVFGVLMQAMWNDVLEHPPEDAIGAFIHTIVIISLSALTVFVIGVVLMATAYIIWDSYELLALVKRRYEETIHIMAISSLDKPLVSSDLSSDRFSSSANSSSRSSMPEGDVSAWHIITRINLDDAQPNHGPKRSLAEQRGDCEWSGISKELRQLFDDFNEIRFRVQRLKERSLVSGSYSLENLDKEVTRLENDIDFVISTISINPE